jgi:hypothetical protein
MREFEYMVVKVITSLMFVCVLVLAATVTLLVVKKSFVREIGDNKVVLQQPYPITLFGWSGVLTVVSMVIACLVTCHLKRHQFWPFKMAPPSVFLSVL